MATIKRNKATEAWVRKEEARKKAALAEARKVEAAHKGATVLEEKGLQLKREKH